MTPSKSSGGPGVTSPGTETLRKQTRSLNAGSRKSKHVLGSATSRASSDSESDTTGTGKNHVIGSNSLAKPVHLFDLKID